MKRKRGSARPMLAVACGVGAMIALSPSAALAQPGWIAQPVRSGWAQLGGGAAHEGTTRDPGPAALSAPRWVASVDEAGEPIRFIGPAGVVATDEVVLAVGFTDADPTDRLFAFDAVDGSVVWSAPVPIAELDSWSTPAIDETTGVAIVASGEQLTAVDLATGAVRWVSALENLVVNASPVVTSDRGAADRVFVTDYGFLGSGGGRLYCVNLDAFDAGANPYQPGELVWSVSLGAPTSGNTPAYADGVVFVATPGPSATRGQVRAYDAGATTPPPPLWTASNPAPNGFYGGVTVSRGAVYAASYGFGFGQLAGNLVKLDAATGAVVWSVASNRTDSTPVVLPNRRIVLSAGLLDDPAFPASGSVPSVQLFQDLGAGAVRVWDSALDTHHDFNGNGFIDAGEPYLALGGWTHHPLAVRRGLGWSVIVGTIPHASGGTTGGQFGAYARVSRIDLARAPGDPAFVTASFDGAGSTPAVIGARLYTLGPGGLHAFGPADPGAGLPRAKGTMP